MLLHAVVVDGVLVRDHDEQFIPYLSRIGHLVIVVVAVVQQAGLDIQLQRVVRRANPRRRPAGRAFAGQLRDRLDGLENILPLLLPRQHVKILPLIPAVGYHFVTATVGVLDQLRPVRTGQSVYRHAHFQIILVANIEQPLDADFPSEFAESFRRIVTLAKRVRRERRLQRTAPRRFISIPRLEGNTEHESDPCIVGPLERLLRHIVFLQDEKLLTSANEATYSQSVGNEQGGNF